MSLKKYLIILAIIINSVPIFSADYYVDSRGGNDSNSGQSPTAAWKSISKVNVMNFAPGDRILFKRGEIWAEANPLTIKNSGNASNRIVYGAYGTGDRPIISSQKTLPGWNITGNWSLVSTNIWRISFANSRYVTRLWLNDKEYRESNNIDNGTNYGIFQVSSINSEDRWNSDGSYIYVYATSNPATFYSSIKVPCTNATDRACKITQADYIIVENLDFQGGYECLQVEGADFLILQDCIIGKFTRNTGIFVYNSSNLRSDRGIIRRNIVDYNNTSSAPYWHNNVSAGIYLASGSSYWKVHDNFVKDWSLAGIDILAWTDSSTYNEIFNNEISAPNLSYGRSLQISGNTKTNSNFKATNNKVYNNYIHHCNVRIQLTGSYNEFMNNIVANISDNYNDFPKDHAFYNAGSGLQLFASSDVGNFYNKIYNNTFYNCKRSGIWIASGQNNYILNNLLINCGANEPNYRYHINYSGSDNIFKNNLMWFIDKKTTDMLIKSNRDGGNVPPDIFYQARTVNGFNSENGKGNIISGNLQHIGSLNLLLKDAPNSDYSLPDGSPAINSGVSVSWMMNNDYYGNSINGTRDIGAIEYSGETSKIAPSITSSPVTNALIGEQYSYDVNAGGNPSPTYKLTASPSGMTINTSTGFIQWTPSAEGSYNVTVEASNGINPADTQSFTINVGTNSSSPVINSSPVTSGLKDQLYTYNVNASGNPAPTYKLSVSPSGMIINSESGLIEWTPDATGNFNVTVVASNGINSSNSQSFVISVSENTITAPSGVISYWKLDEKSGSTFKDQVGNNDAQAISIPVPVTGQVDGAQKFNGSTSKLNVLANSSFDFKATDNFSVEFWYNGSTAPSTVKSAIGRYISNTGARWWVGVNALDGKARFYLAAGGVSAAVNGSVITDGKWHHVAATRNGVTGTIKIYVDGILNSSTTKAFPIDFSSSSANLNIGWFSFQEAYTLNGNLDEVAIQKLELSSSDIQAHYNQGIAGKSYFNFASTSYITVNTKIFLEGPFAAGMMNTTLRAASLIPLNQPYNIAPWNYTGSEKVATIPADVVDWILVELRSGTAASTTLKKRAGFLKKDGSIVDLDGVSKLKFNDLTAGNYYIVVKHRNHLDVMSSSSVSISSTSSLFDFTTGAAKAYGSNSLVNLDNGDYGMISGDGDANGLINILDYGTIARYINQSGYLQGDLDMNKVVDAKDYEKSGLGLFQTCKVPQ